MEARAKHWLGYVKEKKSVIHVRKDEAELSRKGAIIKINAVSSMQQA